jgi:hypothetical protein
VIASDAALVSILAALGDPEAVDNLAAVVDGGGFRGHRKAGHARGNGQPPDH